MIRLTKILSETTFSQLYNKKNKWIEMLEAGKRKQIADNLYVLIQNSYGKMGGHVSIPNVAAVFNPKMYYWEAVDIDDDPDADAVIFGRRSPYGMKISGIGHDGNKKSKSELMHQLAKQLRKKGYWVEASDRVSEILYGANVPYLDDQKVVEKLFGQPVRWLNDKGKYIRNVHAGKEHEETVFGNFR